MREIVRCVDLPMVGCHFEVPMRGYIHPDGSRRPGVSRCPNQATTGVRLSADLVVPCCWRHAAELAGLEYEPCQT
jgi:hypothetical protein